MSIGDLLTNNPNYHGWIEKSKESKSLLINSPKNKKVFYTDLGKNKKEITVKGTIIHRPSGKILIVIRTDQDYPQALGSPRSDGSWEFSGCTLGGVDHQIYAVLLDEKDHPILRSKIITVRLERKF